MVTLGTVCIGKDFSVKIMGIINLSPESFYKPSVFRTAKEISNAAKDLERNGANIIDLGGMSTAPYLETIIPVEKERKRIKEAISLVKNSCSLPISVDTPRSTVAKQAIDSGADAINDITGLKYDKNMANVVSESNLPVIIGACRNGSKNVLSPTSGNISDRINALEESLIIAKKAKIAENNIIVDPSIGFFRYEGSNPFFSHIKKFPWYALDLEVIARLARLKTLSKPICVSVSRKSFIGNLLNLRTEERLIPSLVAELTCINNGANIVRTHDVKEASQAVIMSELFR